LHGEPKDIFVGQIYHTAYVENVAGRALDNDMGQILTAEAKHVSQQAKVKRDELWNAIRDMAMRGNAAGAIAALTMFGSQSLTETAPRSLIFWTLLSFLTGLFALFIQKLFQLKIVSNDEVVSINLVFDEFELSRPPTIYECSVRVLDLFAVVALISGIVMGLLVLFSMTYYK
jgi:hypothetical protein